MRPAHARFGALEEDGADARSQEEGRRGSGAEGIVVGEVRNGTGGERPKNKMDGAKNFFLGKKELKIYRVHAPPFHDDTKNLELSKKKTQIKA